MNSLKISVKIEFGYRQLTINIFLGHGTAQRELTPEEREKARQKLHKNWDDDAEEAEMGTGSVFWILPVLISSLLPSQYLRNFWTGFFCSSSLNFLKIFVKIEFGHRQLIINIFF